MVFRELGGVPGIVSAYGKVCDEAPAHTLGHPREDARLSNHRASGTARPSSPKDASATVGKVRDLASFRRHFRMGFLTMPASQDLSPRPCASAMAPRSQSCHSVGTGSDDGGLENGDFPGPRPPSADRRPPAKPKRHPSTRLSSPADPPMSKSDSGDMLGRKVPPLKPKRSPNTQLSFEPPPPRAPPPPAPLSRPAQERAGPAEDTGEEEDEPVYIEMVGQVFSRESRAVTPHPAPGPTPPAGATTPDSDSDQSEAIYEEMKYPLAEEISISHSSPLPSSTSSTPIPAPFPNLLQHRPPLLAFPQPAAASSGVGAHSKLPVLQLGPKDSSGGGERQADKKEALLGPAPGLRARSHSTPLPPSSQSSSMKLVQGGSKDAKGVSFLLKSEKRDRERDTGTPASTGSQATPSAKVSLSSAPSPSFVSSSTQRSSSRPLLQHPHSAHPLYHALPAYRPPPSDSPLLWTYPSAALRRPPAYDSLRGGATDGCAQPALQGKSGSLSRDGGVSGGGATTDEGAYWPMQRKMSFSHSNRETEKEDGQPGSGTADSRARLDREDRATLSGIPVRSGGGGVVASGASESTGGTGRGPEPRALAKSGLPLPCQTFPACHRNGGEDELGRLGRSSSTSGVRHGNSNMQRQGSLPPREGLSQPPTTGGSGTPPTQGQRDGKLLEVIERKRCLCKEIKAHRRPDRNLCKQDSMPILPSWRRTPEPRKTGTPPCQPPAVLWDTSI
uniref:Neuronal tyrosine phosphorylated phosphoinositide-3-kinase adaptor 1 n=1 Tax=Paramormyrops kingsleyae TaxID=1676925 RepID=A0A3B3RPN6_9TELE